MTHLQVIELIQQLAPLSYQESYDNSGWQAGDTDAETTGVLLTLDVTEEVINEAIEKKCNLIVAHHPVIFPHVKTITDHDWTGRLIMKAIRNDISIYSAHTNVDNMINGVNAKFAEKLNLQNLEILSPIKNDLFKYIVYVPVAHSEAVMNTIFQAGGGEIGAYSECSFIFDGNGTFKPSEEADPAIGTAGGKREYVRENRIEVICPKHLLTGIVRAVEKTHPYEEVAYDILPLHNVNQTKGAGITGTLESGMQVEDFLHYVKKSMNASSLKYTHSFRKDIKKVALCGGSGAFLIKKALAMKCDALITSDIKYHQFFDVEDKMLLIDLGHYETEQYTSEIFYDILKKKFPNFAVYISQINTNPIKYFS